MGRGIREFRDAQKGMDDDEDKKSSDDKPQKPSSDRGTNA